MPTNRFESTNTSSFAELQGSQGENAHRISPETKKQALGIIEPNNNQYLRSNINDDTSAEGVESSDGIEYKNNITHLEHNYGLEPQRSSLYKSIRSVLDNILIAEGLEPLNIKFDISYRHNIDAHVYPKQGHIILSIGTLSFLRDKGILTKDVLAFILAHELTHVKYSGHTVPESEPDHKFRNHIKRSEEERVADIEALRLVNKAGYNPRAGIKFFEAIEDEWGDKSEDPIELGSMLENMASTITKPYEHDQRRIEYMENEISKLLLKHADSEFTPLNERVIEKFAGGGFLNVARKRINEAVSRVDAPWKLVYIIRAAKYKEVKLNADQISAYKANYFNPERLGLSTEETELLWNVLVHMPDIIRADAQPYLRSKFLEEKLKDIINTIADGNIDHRKMVEKICKIFPQGFIGFNSVHEEDNEATFGFTPLSNYLWLTIDKHNRADDEGSDDNSAYIKLLDDLLGNTELDTPWKIQLLSFAEEYAYSQRFGRKIEDLTSYSYPQNLRADCFVHGLSSLANNVTDISRYEVSKLAKCLRDNLEKLIKVHDGGKLFQREGFFEDHLKRMVRSIEEMPKEICKNREIIYLKEKILEFTQGESVSEGSLEDDLLRATYGLAYDVRYAYCYIKRAWKNTIPNDFAHQTTENAKYKFYDSVAEITLKGAIDNKDHQAMVEILKACLENVYELPTLVKAVRSTLAYSRPNYINPYGHKSSSKIYAEQLATAEAAEIRTNKFEAGLAELVAAGHEKAIEFDEFYQIDKLIKNELRALKSRSDEEIATNLSSLPPSKAKNKYIGLILAKPETELANDLPDEDRFARFKLLRAQIFTKSKDQAAESFGKNMHFGRLDTAILTGMKKGFNHLYKGLYVDDDNKLIEELTAEFWPMHAKEIGFSGMDFEAQLAAINDFFHEASVYKEEVLATKTTANSLDEWRTVLGQIEIPYLRCKVGNNIFEYIKDYSDLNQALASIERAYPEASYYRDQIIDEALLTIGSTYEECREARKLLYHGNTLNEFTASQANHLFALRTAAQILYFATEEIKNETFAKMVDGAREENEDISLLSMYEREELLNSLFSGRERITHTPEFENSILNLFLNKSATKEDLNRLRILQEIRIQRRTKRADDYEEDDYGHEEDKNQEMIYDIQEDVDAFYNERQTYESAEVTITQLRQVPAFKAALEACSIETLCQIYGYMKPYFNGEPFIWFRYSTGLSRDKKSDEYTEEFREFMLVKIKDFSDFNESNPALGVLLTKAFNEVMSSRLYDELPDNLTDNAPIVQRIFLELVRALPKEKQNRILAGFLARIAETRNSDANDMAVAFLEKMGPVYLKGGQWLASMGYFDEELQVKLLKLTSMVEPMTMFEVWDVITQNSPATASRIVRIGELWGTASVRQTHVADLDDGSRRVVKVKRPNAINGIAADIESLDRFIQKTRSDSTILNGRQLPGNMVQEIAEQAKTEIETADDLVHQAAFKAKYEGKSLGAKKLSIPEADLGLSDAYVTVEAIADGSPISREGVALTNEERSDLLEFLMDLIFNEGQYHADPHPGNILVGEEQISLIDYGMVSELNETNRYYFFKLLRSLFSGDRKALISTLLEAHISSGEPTEQLKDISIINHALDLFLNDYAAEGNDFTQIGVGLLNILASVGINLPSEIKNLVKVISQMGYLIHGQEDKISQRFAQNIFGNLPTNEEIDKNMAAVESLIGTEVSLEINNDVLHIPDKTLLRKTTTKEITLELNGNFKITKAEVEKVLKSSFPVLMFPLNNETRDKFGLMKGKNNFEIFFGGKWRSLEELVFGLVPDKK